MIDALAFTLTREHVMKHLESTLNSQKTTIVVTSLSIKTVGLLRSHRPVWNLKPRAEKYCLRIDLSYNSTLAD